MVEYAAYLATFILICLTVFQIALILGAPIGKYAWGGYHEVLPLKLRVGSVISILLYSIFALIVLDEAGLTDVMQDVKLEYGIWATTAYLFVGVFMNAISKSRQERALMTPAALTLALLFLFVALS